MSVEKKRTSRFKRTVCLLAVGASVWIAGAPLMENAWAKATWRQVPCWVTEKGNRFFYAVNGSRYVSERVNFWQRFQTEDVMVVSGSGDTAAQDSLNDRCWVSSWNAKESVLRLDAWDHLSEGVSRYSAAGLVLGVTTGMMIFGGRARQGQRG